MCDECQTREDNLIECCNGFKLRTISPGICSQCEQCQSDYGLDEEELDSYCRTVGDEGGFSWQDCEGCRSTLGGDRFAAHGIGDNGDICHLDVCYDCLQYLANGRLYHNHEGGRGR